MNDKLTIYLPPDVMRMLEEQHARIKERVGIDVSKSAYISMLIRREDARKND